MSEMLPRSLVLLTAGALLVGGCASTNEEQPAASRPSATSDDRPGGDRSEKVTPPEPSSHDQAPEFSFETFDGETFRLSDAAGAPIVLNFWESW